MSQFQFSFVLLVLFVASNSLCLLWLLILLCLFVALLGKPTISVEQFDSDAPVAVNLVDPGAIHFGFQLTSKRRHQPYSRTDSDINVHEQRSAAAADFNGLGFGLKSLA